MKTNLQCVPSPLLSVLSPQADIVTGILADWPFNGNPNDISGGGNNLTLTGSPVYTVGQNGALNNAIQFLGTPAQLGQLANGTNLISGLTAFTFSIWFQFPIDLTSVGLFRLGTSFVQNGNVAGTTLIINGSGLSPITATIISKQWNNYVITKNGSVITRYINGILKSSAGSVTVPANDFITIGSTSPASTYDLNFDQTLIYNRSLTAREVLYLFNEGAA